MKKKLFIPLLLLATNAFSGELFHYQDIKQVIQQAGTVRIVVNYSSCDFPDKEAGQVPDIGMGIFTPNEVLINNKGVINASMMHFTLHDPIVPGKPVYQFLRYSIHSDDIIHIVSNSLDAKTYSPLSDSLSINCKIGTAAKVYVN